MRGGGEFWSPSSGSFSAENAGVDRFQKLIWWQLEILLIHHDWKYSCYTTFHVEYRKKICRYLMSHIWKNHVPQESCPTEILLIHHDWNYRCYTTFHVKYGKKICRYFDCCWHYELITSWYKLTIHWKYLVQMWDVILSYVGHDSFICGTSFFHMWDMILSYVGHDSFICGTRLIESQDTSHSKSENQTNAYDRTHSDVGYDAFLRGTWFFCMWDTTH